jgi:hypothetical protein
MYVYVPNMMSKGDAKVLAYSCPLVSHGKGCSGIFKFPIRRGWEGRVRGYGIGCKG